MLTYLSVRLIKRSYYAWFGYLSIVVAVLFILFVLNLVIFHTYILSVNVTTWEFILWQKISYL